MTQITLSNSPHASNEGRGDDRRWRWLVMLALLVLVGLRLVHLGADVPSDLSPESAGVYVDEGYKTLSPRNLVLFGRTHWNPRDDYRGWMKSSPLTQWPYYVLFRLFGTTVEVARLFPIACFALFLVAYVVGLARRYPAGLLVAGAVLLGLEPTVYFFSRIALFEAPLILALYGTLFALARTNARGSLGALLVVASMAAIAALGIKRSALLYFLPVVGAILLIGWTHSDARTRVRFYAGASVAGLGLAILLVVTYGTWGARIAFSPLEFAARAFANPTTVVSFPVVLSGLLCVVHLLVAAPQLLLCDTYRASLAAIAVAGPLLVALFPYDPLRYYVPVLPAYVLLVLEWVHLRAWRVHPTDDSLPVFAIAGGMLLALWWLWAGNSLSHLLLSEVGLRLKIAAPIAVALAGCVWLARRRALSGTTIATCLAVLLLVFAAHAAAVLGAFALTPSYQARSVRAALAQSIPAGSSLGGDWAPFFALGTDIPALYMTMDVNPFERILEIRPDFFLYSDTAAPKAAIAALQDAKGVRLGRAVFEGRYNGSPVILYRLEYDEASPLGDAPRP